LPEEECTIIADINCGYGHPTLTYLKKKTKNGNKTTAYMETKSHAVKLAFERICIPPPHYWRHWTCDSHCSGF